jgi:hypothetical protein
MAHTMVKNEYKTQSPPFPPLFRNGFIQDTDHRNLQGEGDHFFSVTVTVTTDNGIEILLINIAVLELAGR